MARQKLTEGYAERLAQALKEGPRPMSVRGLAEEMGIQYPTLRGSSYGGIRQYAAGKVTSPRVELLRAIADILEVRGEWLAFNRGAMTEAEERARAGVDQAAATVDRDHWGELAERMGEAISEGFPAYETMPAWARTTVLGAWSRLGPLVGGEEDAVETARQIGKALAGPLEGLGIDPAGMDGPQLAEYATAMCAVFFTLRWRRERQMSDMRRGHGEEEANDG